MKYGVLTFTYDGFPGFQEQFEKVGSYSVNLGDNVQSIAIRHLLRQLGIPEEDIVSVNRDTLRTYAGPDVTVLMNAVFPASCFPLPPQIRPIYIGFHASEATIAAHLSHFKSHAPIGCRDTATADILKKHGVEAFVTGCLTLTLPTRPAPPPRPKLFVVYGSKSGALPDGLLARVPETLLQNAEFVFQRHPVDTYPLSTDTSRSMEAYAAGLLEKYKAEASLVLTPLHHAATPCIAFGIPVIVARNKPRSPDGRLKRLLKPSPKASVDARFSFLETLLPIHTPERFGEIDWAPKPVAIDDVRQTLIEAVRSRLFA